MTFWLALAVGVLALGLVVLGVMLKRQQAAIRALQASADSLSTAQSTQEAIASERDRIYRDLHDDIGGRLLTLAHGSSDPDTAAIARDVLQDLLFLKLAVKICRLALHSRAT